MEKDYPDEREDCPNIDIHVVSLQVINQTHPDANVLYREGCVIPIGYSVRQDLTLEVSDKQLI